MSAWQPIETAPRDGTPILLGLHYGPRRKFMPYVAIWDVACDCWARDMTGSYLFPPHMQGWFTHWMPLPEPPEKRHA